MTGSPPLLLCGPSPRVWGEPCFIRQSTVQTRTIPTRVGRTRRRSRRCVGKMDHPHACGENVCEYFFRCHFCGPSPRVWGEPWRGPGGCGCRRTIPTRVGRTDCSDNVSKAQADHPHACGENEYSWIVYECSVGPSPRVWGERQRLHPEGVAIRTIPTRVGRTCSMMRRALFRTDHPHACGENLRDPSEARSTTGPSPRVWGELGAHGDGTPCARTIPTRVGRTLPSARDITSKADHPHACGENPEPKVTDARTYGPSPRVWGELAEFDLFSGAIRTIPTRVGRTTRNTASTITVSDHPHACGENPQRVCHRARGIGPSPRVWGEPIANREIVNIARTIPTRVGRT